VRKLLQLNLEEQLRAPTSQQEFEKYFAKKFKDPMQRYTYLRLMDVQHFKSIFIGDFDSELLIKVIDTFQQMVISNPHFNNETEQAFVSKFLLILTETPNFEFSLEFLGKKEKEQIAAVVTALTLIPVESMTLLIEKYKI
jgi:hypothetical protein